jgi:hypothetical protein
MYVQPPVHERKAVYARPELQRMSARRVSAMCNPRCSTRTLSFAYLNGPDPRAFTSRPQRLSVGELEPLAVPTTHVPRADTAGVEREQKETAGGWGGVAGGGWGRG